MHSRMNEWVAMSAAQRAQARLNFGAATELSKQLTAEEKLAKWQAYQALSSVEKQKLLEKSGPRASGAALAARPVASQKLAGILPHSINAPVRGDGNTKAAVPALVPAAVPPVSNLPLLTPGG